MPLANLTLRFGAARLRASVCWPRSEALALAFVLAGDMPAHDTVLHDCVVVALLETHRVAEELGALQWLGEHARDLGAISDRVIVAGGARAARLAVAVRDNGWPVLDRQVLVHPRFSSGCPIPSSVGGVAPATVVSRGASHDDGRRYAALLRDAGIDVEEVRR